MIATAPPRPTRSHLLLIGVAAPLATAGLAYLLWWISDRLVVVGPLDRASFGWMVVVPTWLAAPVVAGFAWRPIDERTAWAVAGVVGTVMAGLSTVLLWRSVAFPPCGTGPIHTPPEMVLPSLVVGAVVGAGFAASGLVSAHYARERRVVAAVGLGATFQLLMSTAAIFVAVGTILGPACQRPGTI